MSVLGLDKLGKLETSSSSSSLSSSATPFKITPSVASSSSNGKRRTVSSMPLGTSVSDVDNVNLSSSNNNPDGTDSQDDCDEMMEVTPDVQMFIGHSHFLADMNGGSASHSDEDTPLLPVNSQPQAPKVRLKSQMSSELQVEAKEPCSKVNNGTPITMSNEQDMLASSIGDKQFLCRLCGRSAPSGAALFAHLLYPHYAHLWRTEIPHRANQYLCKQCPYSTTKRQHFVQHVAKVHEDLKKKLLALGENLEVLDNLNPKNTNGCTDRIVSKVAKFKTLSDELSYDDNLAMSSSEYSNVNSPASAANALITTAAITSAASNENLDGTNEAMKKGSSNNSLELSSFGLIPGRFPRGYKPFVKCRLCGKGWKGKDNFFTHLVSTHFKHMWSNEVPKHADMYHCHVGNCQYQSKYRYNFLFHLAGKHKQLKEKLASDGISLDVLIPIEVDEVDEEMLAGGSPTILKTQSVAMQQHFLNSETNMQKFLAATAPPPNSGGGGRTPSHGKYSAANSTVRLICRVCKKISFNHTCHRQHVVSKHFQDFWSDKSPDQTGLFHCHHCNYQTPNRSVFVIHLAYTHSELKTKLKESGSNPDFADPDVYGKRKYRRSHYDNTQHLVHSLPGDASNNSIISSPPTEDQDLGPSGLFASPAKKPSLEILIKDQNDSPAMLPPPRGHLAKPASVVSTASTDNEGCNEELEEEEEEKLQKFVCRLCKTEFDKQKAIVEHLALAHFYQVWEDDRPENGSFFVPSDGPFVCPHCPFNSTARAAFIAHFVNQHEALKSVMSLQYGDKTVEDLYTVSNGTSNDNLDDETYDEGEDDEEEEDDIDDDEENAPDDLNEEDLEEDMDDEMDGQTSDLDFSNHHANAAAGNKLSPPAPEAVSESSAGW